MTRQICRYIDGKCVWFSPDARPEVEAPAVHQDSFRDGLIHPKTGEKVYDHTRWNQINREHGLRVVGNDWANGDAKNDLKERVTDDKVMDAIEKAYAIESDPDKRREKRYQEQRDLESFYGRQHDTIKNIIQIKELSRR